MPPHLRPTANAPSVLTPYRHTTTPVRVTVRS